MGVLSLAALLVGMLEDTGPLAHAHERTGFLTARRQGVRIEIRPMTSGDRLLMGVVARLADTVERQAESIPNRMVAHSAIPRPVMPCHANRQMKHSALPRLYRAARATLAPPVLVG